MSDESHGPETTSPQRGPRRIWAARLSLLVYLALLSTPWLRPAGRGAVGGGGLFDLRSDSRIAAVARQIAVHGVVEIARFAPLGALLALSLLGLQSRGRRMAVAAMAALLLGAALAAGIQHHELGAGVWPGPSDLLLPIAGCALGIAAAVAWRLPPSRRLRFVVALSGLALMPLVTITVLGYLSTEPAPLPFEAEHVDSVAKRHLFALFRGKNPKEIPPGEVRSVELTEHDVDVLLAWVLPLVAGEDRAKGRIELTAAGDATLELSVRVPGRGAAAPYVNLIAGARPRLQAGGLRLEEPRLRLGRTELPPFLLRLLAPAAAGLLDHDRRIGPLLGIVQSLAIDEDGLRVSYGRAVWPSGMLAGLIWGEGGSGEMRLEVSSCAERLLDAAPGFPAGDARFGAAVEAAFAWAGEGPASRSQVQRNRAALLALGVLLGHWRVQQFVGSVLDEDDWRRASGLDETTLRGRRDWTKHFFVSCALTVLSAQAPSDEAGLLKEELDADGGSGFSFGDLAADRAGTSFALAATRDEAAARAVQERIAAGFRVDDFFPDATDLPEGIPDAELQSRYGGVGGPLYRDLSQEIERRLLRCAAYRDSPPTP